MSKSNDLNISKAVYLEHIQIADLLVSFNIDSIVFFIEETNDYMAIKPIIKFLKRLRSKLPSKNLADKYWSLDEDNLFYYNQKEFKKKVGDEIETIPIGAPLHSEISHKGGFGALLLKAYEASSEFIEALEKLEIVLSKDIHLKDKSLLSQKKLVEKEKQFLKLLYDTIDSNFIIKNKFEEFYDTTLDKKIEISHSEKSKLFPNELRNYQVGYLLKRIVSYYKPIEFRLRYNLTDADGITPNNYHNAKRTLDKYLSKYKNREKT